MAYPSTRSETARLAHLREDDFSLSLHLNFAAKYRLEAMYNDYDALFVEDGNNYLYPIQERRGARVEIGFGSLISTLLILIKSHIVYEGESIYSNASEDMLNHTTEEWAAESSIASLIIQKYNNTETIEDLINDDKRLSTEIHYAAENYGITPQIVG
jgi:hypothetical protein